MAVQFTCPHCSRLLRVDQQMVGHAVQCANCLGGVIVPDPQARPVETTESPSPQRPTGESPEQPSRPAARRGPGTHSEAIWNAPVTVTRMALYSIGALLIGASIVSFVLGWAMGRQTTASATIGEVSQSIYGRISYTTSRGKTAADSEATVIVVPVGLKPDEKLAPEPVRPDATPAASDNATVAGIRAIGGDVARTNRLGDYRLELPRAGEYFVFVLSGHVARSRERPPTTKEIVELGQYFQQANVLLGNNDFVWAREVVRKPTRFDVVFPST